MKITQLFSTKRRKLAVAAGAAAVLAAGGVGVATAVGESDHEQSPSGPQVAQAKAAALRIAAGGTVSDVQHEGENGGHWVVEVLRPDGSLVSIQLDNGYKQVPFQADSESHNGKGP
jgi:hypothetical protein